MSKKSKGPVVFDSGPSYGVGLYEDAKARDKHQTLMEDYQELQKEVDVMRSKLEARKQRKMVLAAEVRFLRRRYEYFMQSKTLKSLEQEKLVQPPNLVKQTKQSRPRLPPIPETKPKKKYHRKILHGRKEANQHSLTPVADLDHKERKDIRRKTVTKNITPVLDLNQKERMHANGHTALRNTTVAFDLNQDNSHTGKDLSIPSRAPIFDLNEISTGDEDFQSNVEAVKLEEVKKSLMRCPNDEFQNDLMLSVCRNAGEGPSRVGKRKISWQDPSVALRV